MCSQRSLLHVRKCARFEKWCSKTRGPRTVFYRLLLWFIRDFSVNVSQKKCTMDKFRINIFSKFSKLWCTNSWEHVANVYLSWRRWAAIILQLLHVAATCPVVFRFFVFLYILVLLMLSILFVSGVCDVIEYPIYDNAGTVKPVFLRALYFTNFASLASSRK